MFWPCRDSRGRTIPAGVGPRAPGPPAPKSTTVLDCAGRAFFGRRQIHDALYRCGRDRDADRGHLTRHAPTRGMPPPARRSEASLRRASGRGPVTLWAFRTFGFGKKANGTLRPGRFASGGRPAHKRAGGVGCENYLYDFELYIAMAVPQVSQETSLRVQSRPQPPQSEQV